MSRLGTIVLRMLVPALVLPALAAAAAVAGDDLHPTTAASTNVWLLAALVYLFILLGSMTLNAWLLLRHPGTFSDSELPTAVSAAQLTQWMVVVIWSFLLLGGEPPSVTLALPAAVAGLSVYIFVASLRRPKEWAAQVDAVELGRPTRILALGYLGFGAAALVLDGVSVALSFDARSGAGVLTGPVSWAVLLLGLPWSHPLYVLLYLVGIGGRVSNNEQFFMILPALLGLSVVVNMVLAALLLWSSGRRAAIVNWFFRLKGFGS